ncbi:MAG TPA: diguanylate cyclase [bacterium]|nr:diguanylate cyclase [bacterium]
MWRDKKDFSVLVVGSDDETLHRLKQSLRSESLFPARIESATSVPKALGRIENRSYDLLLLDALPQPLGGLELYQKIVKKEKPLPFVLMTPIRDDRLVREALRQGVAGLIIKSESHYRDVARQLKHAYEKFYGQRGGESDISKRGVHADMTEQPTSQQEEHSFTDFSIKDELTGLYNHSYFQDRIVREFSRASRYSYSISCVLLDIDHFKEINEERGYRVGDAVLKECSRILFDNSRMSDLTARYGGGEFSILLPHIDYQGAVEVARRLRIIFSQHIFLADLEDINLTVSIGVASYPEDPMKHRSDLIGYARQALLRAKAEGRNRMTLYRDIVPLGGPEMPDLKINEEKVTEFQRRLSDIAEATRRSYIEASRALIFALESKDRFTAGHSASCAKYAYQVAESMGMSVEDAEVVEHAALLHDIGKICIADEILLKPGKLTFVEYESIKQHPYLGYRILRPIKLLREESTLVLHHHEWFNGEGYPSHLKGEEIPLGARIISVIDSYDTMRIAGSRYKKTMSIIDAVNELIHYAGTQFDPRVVKAFIEILNTRKELLSEDYEKDLLEQRLNPSLPPQST